MSTQLESDYLVVGAGAMGLAFTDTLLDETDADVIIVDRYDKPGGHWRVAYDFVRLHQPSEFYGVNSRPLGSGTIETDGYNAGLFELADLAEIRDYFERVMREKFLPSGRVRYLPNSEYRGDGAVERILSGETVEIHARRRIVDATYLKATVPATTPPPFAVRDGASVLPPNGLARIQRGHDRYVVIGGGKTGVDTVLWLLTRGTRPDAISWVVPRDAWLNNREYVQPGPEFAERADGFAMALIEATLGSSTIEEWYEAVVSGGLLFPLSDDVSPQAYRCATVTRAELADLRTIGDVIRLGHVLEVNGDGLVLEHGTRSFPDDVLYIDCTANGLSRKDPIPVFQPGRITLQSVYECQQVFSAAFIAHIEARGGDDHSKNLLTTPVPNPDRATDILLTQGGTAANEALWWQDPEIVEWRQRSRLAGLGTRVGTPLPPAGPDRDQAVAEACELWPALAAKFRKLHDEVGLAQP